MGWFGSKEPLYLKSVVDQLSKQTSRISDLELEIEKFKSQLISLRGLVNRKLGSELPEETQTSKSVDGHDELRKK